MKDTSLKDVNSESYVLSLNQFYCSGQITESAWQEYDVSLLQIDLEQTEVKCDAQ